MLVSLDTLLFHPSRCIRQPCLLFVRLSVNPNRAVFQAYALQKTRVQSTPILLYIAIAYATRRFWTPKARQIIKGTGFIYISSSRSCF